jgi:hypothetical protein
MKQSGVVYFYNLNSAKGRQIKMLCLKMGLKIRVVDKMQFAEPVGAVAGVRGFELTGEPYEGEGFEDEMLLMKDFTNAALDQFLNGFRRMKIEKVALKAVLTEENCKWNSLQLHEELVKEHEAMQQYQ